MESRQWIQIFMCSLGPMNQASDAYTRLPHTFGRTAWLFQVPDFQLGITEKPWVKQFPPLLGGKNSERSGKRVGELNLLRFTSQLFHHPNPMTSTVNSSCPWGTTVRLLLLLWPTSSPRCHEAFILSAVWGFPSSGMWREVFCGRLQ